MLMHESNLFHLGIFIASFFLLDMFARNTRIPRMRTVSTLIQLSVVLICVDLLIGFTVIDRVYGSSLSAGWMSKALFGFPALLLIGIWRTFYHHRRAQQAATKPPD